MAIAVGTVSTRGWARTPRERIREAMNHYTEAGYSQSQIYQGNVRSLAKAQQMYAQDPDGLASKVKSDLTAIYGNIFPEGVEVETKWEYLPDTDVRYRVIIQARAKSGGIWYDVERYVETETSRIEDE